MPNDDPIFPEQSRSLIGRVLPPLMLIGAFGGFVALAVYAYNAGTQSVDEGNLMVVEADKTPLKEKPQDPGGMQFPNQDKTIFETFSGGAKKPANVERVLPTPEEPMPKEANASKWVNDKLADKKTAPLEQVFGSENADADIAPAQTAQSSQPKVLNVQEELGKQALEMAPSAGQSTITAPAVEAVDIKPIEVQTKPVAVPEKPMATPLPAPVAPIVELKKPVETPTPKPIEKPKASSGKTLVQLGAYHSEAEAKADFAKLQKKHPALAGKTPTIVRADLGAKGIYYRLRVATDDGKALCSKLSGAACMVVK